MCLTQFKSAERKLLVERGFSAFFFFSPPSSHLLHYAAHQPNNIRLRKEVNKLTDNNNQSKRVSTNFFKKKKIVTKTAFGAKIKRPEELCPGNPNPHRGEGTLAHMDEWQFDEGGVEEGNYTPLSALFLSALSSLVRSLLRGIPPQITWKKTSSFLLAFSSSVCPAGKFYLSDQTGSRSTQSSNSPPSLLNKKGSFSWVNTKAWQWLWEKKEVWKTSNVEEFISLHNTADKDTLFSRN